MKKLIIIIMLAILPLNVLGYSDYVIPGGKTIGIEVNNQGVMVIGFYKINNKLNKNKLKVGDLILKINNTKISSLDDLINEIDRNVQNNKVLMTIKRDNKLIDIDFELVKVNNTYKTGLYVKDSVRGIGTLSYIDPNTKIFGALGHEIIESNSGVMLEIDGGSIFKSYITGIDRSEIGNAGSKNAKLYSNQTYGVINKNTKKGIYGIYNEDISNYETIKVGNFEDIKEGFAYIYTVLDGETINKYFINIDRVINSDIKSIHFEIIDKDLINKTGGIVQGMSGSPIIQNDMIIGAVTHVIVDNPITGYGILITKMLEEGDK